MARAACLAFAVLLLAFASSAHAAATWLDPAPVSPPSDPVPTEDLFTFGAKVAFDGNGNALLVWPRQDGTSLRIQASFRPPGESFGAPVDISDVATACPGCGLEVQVAFDAQGNALAAWNQAVGSDQRIQVGFRPAGAPCTAGNRCGFEAPVNVSPAGEEACCPELAFDRFGNALVGWGGSVGGGALKSRVAFRPAGGGFGLPDTISTGSDQNVTPAIDFDQNGNAIAVWINRNETNMTERTQAAVRPPNGSFGTPENLTTVAPACDCPIPTDVEFSPDGRAVAVWPRFDGTTVDPPDGNYRVEVADQLVPGSAEFGSSAIISAAGQDAGQDAGLDLDVDSRGNALVVWTRSDGANSRVQAAFRPAGGSFVEGENISPAGEGACCPRVAFGPKGNAIALWEQQLSGTNQRIYAANRPAGASCTAGNACGFAYEDISGSGDNALSPTLAFDSEGNAIASWSTIITVNGADVGRVFAAAGYDDSGPQLRALQFPSSPARTPLSFSVSPLDVWSPIASTTWDFGDGSTASGTNVSHAYASPGSYLASVTSTDAVGNSSRAQGTVTISGPAADRIAPALSGLRMSPTRFRAAPRGRSIASAVGSRLGYRLSEPAQVRFRVERATRGRRVRGRCRRETARNRSRRRCTRYVGLRGSFTHRGRESVNSLRFRGRLRGRTLRRGRYRLAARATDPSGNSSRTRRAGFRIVGP